MLTIERSARGELQVKAAQAIGVGGLIITPAVPGLPCIMVPKSGAPISPLAVKIHTNFAQKDLPEDFVVVPSTKLPPRGVLLGEWDKAVFVGPFWAIQRRPAHEQVTCIFKEVEVNVLWSLNHGGGGFNLQAVSSSAHETVKIPVLVNSVDLIEGEVLTCASAPAVQKVKDRKLHRWDTVKRT
jgi:hypothetical protein